MESLQRLIRRKLRRSTSKGYTGFRSVKFTYTWEINDFSIICKNRPFVRSPKFPCPDTDHVWILRFQPITSDGTSAKLSLGWQVNEGLLGQASDDCEAAKEQEEDCEQDIIVCFRFYLLDNKGRKELAMGSSLGERLTKDRCYTDGKITIFDRHLIAGDKIVIFCEIKEMVQLVSDSRKLRSIEATGCPSPCEQLQRLQEEDILTDVTIVVGHREIRAHRAMLAAVSPVFLAMFTADMKETRESRVIINDVSHKAIAAMVAFCYSNQVKDLEPLVPDMLYVAEKYSIQGLKDLCERAMSIIISSDNVLDILDLADKYNAPFLWDRATRFISLTKNSFQNMVSTSQWKDLRPDIAKKLFAALAEIEPKSDQ